MGLAVEDLAAAVELYRSTLGGRLEHEGRSETEDMVYALVRVGESELELMHSGDPESPVGKFIARRGAGVHHVAYEVDELDSELERLRAAGCEIVGDVRTGVHGTRVAFIHPRSMGGVLTELVEVGGHAQWTPSGGEGPRA